MSALHLVTQHLDTWLAADNEKKSGRGRASGNAAAVYGIKKLRELILELAVRGKLVPQERIPKEVMLGQIGTWAIGSGFPSSEQGVQTGSILFAKVSDMNNEGNEKFISKTNNTITQETAKRLKVNVHPAGTVIFPKIGGAIATNKRRILIKPTAIDNNCLGITPAKGVSTDWLFLLLSSIDLSKYQAGTSVPALAQGVLQDIPVTLPDEHQQHRIVAKVDELMALCDQLETQHNNAAEAHEQLVSALLQSLTQSADASEFTENWQRIATHFDTLFTTETSIDALKQTLLQLAVMGKLVPQDPKDEPASELLKRIKAEKEKLVKAGKIRKEKPLPPITEEEKPFELPVGWEWVRLGESGITSTGGTPKTSENHLFDGSIPFIGPGQISPDGNLLKAEKFLTENGAMQSTLAEKGDVLMVCIGGSIGKSLIVEKKLTFNQQINCIKPVLVNTYYLNCAMNSTAFQLELISKSTGSATPIINRTKWDELLVSLPPLTEQHRIVAKVDELMALCDQLKNKIAEASEVQRRLADGVVGVAIESAL